MGSHLEAFGRSLSWWCQGGGGELESLLNRIVFEARLGVTGDVKGMALLWRTRNAPSVVARVKDAPALPAETLQSLFLEHLNQRGGCRVRDHALDTIRFIESRFRTSIISSVQIPSTIAADTQAALWWGLFGGASAEVIVNAEEMAKELSVWLSSYSGVILAQIQFASQRQTYERRISDLTSLLHDARAPLGVLKYLAGEGSSQDYRKGLAHELEYLDRILGQGAPRTISSTSCVSDIGTVLSRVGQRYAYEMGVESIRVERGYQDIRTTLPELDIERVVTNLVSNAYRHSPGCKVTLSVEVRDNRAVIVVRDNGRGIPNQMLEAIRLDQELLGAKTAGWGIGLKICKAKLRVHGGDLRISSQEGEGSVFEVWVPLSVISQSAAISNVADGGIKRGPVTTVDVVIIDDDEEHSASLTRLLDRYGIRARQCATVDAYLTTSQQGESGIVLCDAHMPDGGAERLLTLLADRPNALRVAVMSGGASDEYLYKVSALGAQAFFCKPVDLSEVCTWIREVQGMPATV